ncbi:unnamed protein product [Cunninghamella blakesleeana]
MTTDNNKINCHYESDSHSTSSSTISIVSERSSLLPYKHNNKHDTTYGKELKWLILNSLPIILTYILETSFPLTNIYFLGHLGSIELGASALGSMLANISLFAIVSGSISSLDTLMTQAAGSGNKTLLGIHLKRSILILSLLFIPISIVWLNITPLLLILKQEQQIAEYVGLYLRYILIGVLPFTYFEVLKKFLQAQGIMQASTYCLIIVSPINIVLNYLFIHQFGLGFIGAPLATSVSYWLMFLLLSSYIVVLGHGKTAFCGQWKKECLNDWGTFLKLAYFGVITVITEWIAFEVASLASSYLGSTDLAAQSILITLSSSTYALPFGLSVAVANRVGNALGEANGQKAKYATIASLGFGIILSIMNSTVILLFKDKVAYLFTTETDVGQLVAAVLPLCALFQFQDSLANCSAGVIRALGRQHISAKINFFAYFIVSLPLGYYLTFIRHWGLYGLWTGLSIALFLCALGQCFNLYLVNWNDEALKAHHRIKKEEEVLLYLPH